MMTCTLCRRERERESEREAKDIRSEPNSWLYVPFLCRWRSPRTSCGKERRAIHPSSSRASALVSALAHRGCMQHTNVRIRGTQADTAQMHGNSVPKPRTDLRGRERERG